MTVRHVDVDAQHLPEQRRGVLRIAELIVAATAIAEADVEEAVGPEGEMPAVVVRRGLVDDRLAAGPPQIETRRGTDRHGGCGRALEARDHGIAVGVGEVDEEVPGRLSIRGEGHAQQALLTVIGDDAREVE
jgi:hypothetical protein